MDDGIAVASEPRLKEVRHAVLGLIKAAGLTSAPVQLNDIYHHAKKSHDLIIHGGDEQAVGNKIDACTKRIGNEIFIVFNKSRHLHRQRFSVAHELGHLYMGHVHNGSSIELGSENHDEKEANHFAAHLLMPPAFLRSDIKAGLKSVAKLAKKYEVSEEAMWWQIDKSGLLRLL